MGDFDKQQTSSAANEKKKLVMVGVLGAVLLGIGAFHFMKSNPAAASAAAVPSSDSSIDAAFAAEETPAQETAALQIDPTATLLRNPQGPDPILDAVPRNPFRIGSAWETTLVRHVDEESTPDTHVQSFSTPTAAPKTVDTSTMKLTGIFRQDQKLYAIINGDIYTVGMAVDNARITEITSTKVTFQRVESPNGPKAVLGIEPKLK